VDAQNSAHLAYCPEFALPRGAEGYLRPYNTLWYASNKSGTWSFQKIADVADQSGDAGAGASIAIGPNGTPAIAAWYNERASTGSSQFCQLNYFTRNPDGTWAQQTLATTTAGYLAGDGDKGTGFAPYLRFDAAGRPHIGFCDDAAQHFASTGQNEYAGMLRHAYYNGSAWVFETIYAQSDALAAQIVYPAMALYGNEAFFTGLDRRTIWQQPDFRVAASTYQFFTRSSIFP
jgi:hypothetical protein